MELRRGPRFCVWELTLACNASCVHCGSSAGRARPQELNRTEAFEVCDSLARIGTSFVTFSGGEPLLRDDWYDLARRLTSQRVRVDVISNGLAITRSVARQIADAGIHSVTLSIDGTQQTHDRLRATRDAFHRTVAAVGALREVGLPVGACTQVNRWNIGELDRIETVIKDAGAMAWQLQLTMPMGRCADRDDLAIAPAEVPQVVAFIASQDHQLPVCATDNIGWMPRCEPSLRRQAPPDQRFYPGCQAGLSVIGLTSDGTVRGCLSMPSCFDEGNVRRRPLEEIWLDQSLFSYNRAWSERDMTGACADCAFRRVCRGGCKTLAHAATGRISENPFCVRTVSEQGRSL